MVNKDLAPFVPTKFDVVTKMLKAAQVGSEDIVYDLGCGDGRVLIAAVKDFGAKKAVGYEVRDRIYDIAKQNIEAQNLQNRIEVIKGDFFDAEISNATVIILYLRPEDNERLKPKLKNEARPGTRIISRSFRIRGWRDLKDYSTDYKHLYLYITPDSFIQKKNWIEWIRKRTSFLLRA